MDASAIRETDLRGAVEIVEIGNVRVCVVIYPRPSTATKF